MGCQSTHPGSLPGGCGLLPVLHRVLFIAGALWHRAVCCLELDFCGGNHKGLIFAEGCTWSPSLVLPKHRLPLSSQLLCISITFSFSHFYFVAFILSLLRQHHGSESLFWVQVQMSVVSCVGRMPKYKERVTLPFQIKF